MFKRFLLGLLVVLLGAMAGSKPLQAMFDADIWQGIKDEEALAKQAEAERAGSLDVADSQGYERFDFDMDKIWDTDQIPLGFFGFGQEDAQEAAEILDELVVELNQDYGENSVVIRNFSQPSVIEYIEILSALLNGPEGASEKTILAYFKKYSNKLKEAKDFFDVYEAISRKLRKKFHRFLDKSILGVQTFINTSKQNTKNFIKTNSHHILGGLIGGVTAGANVMLNADLPIHDVLSVWAMTTAFVLPLVLSKKMQPQHFKILCMGTVMLGALIKSFPFLSSLYYLTEVTEVHSTPEDMPQSNFWAEVLGNATFANFVEHSALTRSPNDYSNVYEPASGFKVFSALLGMISVMLIDYMHPNVPNRIDVPDIDTITSLIESLPAELDRGLSREEKNELRNTVKHFSRELSIMPKDGHIANNVLSNILKKCEYKFELVNHNSHDLALLGGNDVVDHNDIQHDGHKVMNIAPGPMFVLQLALLDVLIIRLLIAQLAVLNELQNPSGDDVQRRELVIPQPVIQPRVTDRRVLNRMIAEAKNAVVELKNKIVAQPGNAKRFVVGKADELKNRAYNAIANKANELKNKAYDGIVARSQDINGLIVGLVAALVCAMQRDGMSLLDSTSQLGNDVLRVWMMTAAMILPMYLIAKALPQMSTAFNVGNVAVYAIVAYIIINEMLTSVV